MNIEPSTEPKLRFSEATGAASLPDFEALNDRLTAANEIVGNMFMGLSEAIQKIAHQARSVVELSTAVAKLAAGSESEQFHKLSGVVELTERFEDLAESSQQRFTNIQHRLSSSRRSVAALERIPPTLITIGTLSRIESGRIEGTQVDANGLALNITELAGKVDTNIGKISSHAAKLAQIVASGVGQIGKIAGQERRRARIITNHAQGVFTTRRENAQKSDKALAEIHERYTEIRSAIETMVISLQAQDIARQRLEHVQQAFQQISTSGMIGKEKEIARILTLQLSQLDSTRDYIMQSISSVVNSLGSVSEQLSRVSSETTTPLSQVDEDGNSLDSGMKTALLNISAEVDRHRNSIGTTMSVLNALVPWLAVIRQCISELEEVESGIRRTALNARIETSHLGGEGAAMRALASELQTITEGSKSHIEELLANIAAIETEIARLSELENSGDDADASTATNKRELDQLCQEVFRTNHLKTSKLKELIRETESLKRALRSGIEQTVKAHAVREAFENVHRELEGVVVRLGSTAETSPDPIAEELGEKFTAFYSMKSERDLHEQVFGRLDIGRQQSTAADSSEGLGDGIELF